MYEEQRKITNTNIVVKHRAYINGTIEVLFSGRGENIEEILAKTFQSPEDNVAKHLQKYETKDFAKNLAVSLECDVRFYEQTTSWIFTGWE